MPSDLRPTSQSLVHPRDPHGRSSSRRLQGGRWLSTHTQAGSARAEEVIGSLSTAGSEHPDRSGPRDRQATSLAAPCPGCRGNVPWGAFRNTYRKVMVGTPTLHLSVYFWLSGSSLLRGRRLVAVSRGCSLGAMLGFSLLWLMLLSSGPRTGRLQQLQLLGPEAQAQ